MPELKNPRKRYHRSISPTPLLEGLESRTLLTAAITPTLLDGAWTWKGMGAAGSITFDNGVITAGSITDLTGTNTLLTGSFTTTSNGILALTINAANYAGGVNSTADVISLTLPGSTATMALLVKNSSAGFTNADLDGTWSLLDNATDAGSTGQGTIEFDGLGHIRGGTIKLPTGTRKITGGTYTVSAAGVISASYYYAGPKNDVGQVTIGGQLSKKKDVAALAPANLKTADEADKPLMEVWIKNAGATPKENLAGTWEVTGDGFGGSIIVSATGTITGGTVTDSIGLATAVKGTLTPGANGKITLTLKLSHGAVVKTYTVSGSLNAARNLAAMEKAPSANPATSSGDSLTILTFGGNRPPTFSKAKVFTPTVIGAKFTFTFEELLARTKAADPDNDTLRFVVQSVISGTLTLDGNAVIAGVTELVAGKSLVWTPADGPGTVSAFTVTVSDGTSSSANEVEITAKTLSTPVVSIALIGKTTVNEFPAASSNVLKYRITRVGGNKGAELSVKFTTTGSTLLDGTAFTSSSPIAANGTVVIPKGKSFIDIIVTPKDDVKAEPANANGEKNLKLTLAAGAGTSFLDTYSITTVVAKKDATGIIKDRNVAPTITPTTPVAASTNTEKDLTFAALKTATNAIDRENGTLKFTITAIVGSLKKNGNTVNGEVTIESGDTLTWVPHAGAVAGTISVLNVKLSDELSTTATKVVQFTLS